jgi:hypothetical protein
VVLARAVLFASVVAVLPAPVTAQRLPPRRFRPYEPSIGGEARPPAAAALCPRATDYRYEGLVVGAVVVGTGALIGGMISKRAGAGSP